MPAPVVRAKGLRAGVVGLEVMMSRVSSLGSNEMSVMPAAKAASPARMLSFPATTRAAVAAAVSPVVESGISMPKKLCAPMAVPLSWTDCLAAFRYLSL